MDEALAGGKRSLRTIPQALLLGPTGARLWADYVLPQPGFAGAIDFIHKLNIPLLFTVECTGTDVYEPCGIEWRPSHLSLTYRNEDVRFSEKKFVTWDDCAVSCQTWENIGSEPLALKLRVNGKLFGERSGDGFAGSLAFPEHGFRMTAALGTDASGLADGIVLQPGERIRFVVAAALGLEETDPAERLRERIGPFTGGRVPFDDIAPRHQRAYQSWFDRAPSFVSNEPLLDKTWQYRWYVLRHNLAHPGIGNLRHPLFYEGRSHKMTKRPYAPEGWEFSKMIPLTVPMHLLESRWHHDAEYGEGSIRNMLANQGEDGFYPATFVNKTLHSYANFFGWAVYQFYLVHRDRELVRELLPSLKKQIEGEAAKLGNSADTLIIEYVHQHTGKEYQPSYWYFHDYPKDPKDPSAYTPLKRVDRSIYHYLNCRGAAELCRLLDDPDAERFAGWADRVRDDVLDKMWDEPSRFFYDLHHETDRKAMVKNIVGFYPYWAGVTDAGHAEGLNRLFRTEEFATPCPFPSVSADCPVYTAEGGWQGLFLKGRNGCVWDGPTWPYTNSVVLDALAGESKRGGHRYDEAFGRWFREFSLLHYSSRDLGRPYLVEHYNSRTGEAISDEADYNHSYYIDLVVRHIAGLNAEADRIVLDPVDIGLRHFDLDNVRIAGRNVRVSYRRPDPGAPAENDGYRLYADGREVLRSDSLTRMEYRL
ncbi:hypothetical protein H7C18_07140 [Cohnella sp. CBP 2801]|uniref:Mannosylglycerate hydrolase MGH1-like glycoside hydrolase domain-containing protein n=1 Tax=Cohnella zeiphila TaxID=2761120 RepID=A0A7X0SIU2_9BACL|nr:hypothetical protein [Cohnella zeiphila]